MISLEQVFTLEQRLAINELVADYLREKELLRVTVLLTT
jgi:hypothetical protein